MNFGGAARYCRNLTEGGFTDWSLPTMQEVWDIYMAGPISDDMSANYFWTTDKHNNDWHRVNVNDGNLDASGGSSVSYTRCVR